MNTENGSSGSEVTGGRGRSWGSHGASTLSTGWRSYERMGSFRFRELEVVWVLESMR